MCDWKGISIAALAIGVIGMAWHTVESILTMGYYTDPAYYSIWSKIMIPAAGPPPASFMALSFVFGLVGWAIFAFVYAKLGSAIKQKDELKKGLKFGALAFLLAGIPNSLTMYLLLNIPSGLLAAWMVSPFMLYLTGGMVCAQLVKAD